MPERPPPPQDLCPRCGGLLTRGPRGGLCPRCLLNLGLDADPTEEEPVPVPPGEPEDADPGA
jgi:hypothetical protein